ncbi:aspartyl-phosphate phosphatase Spo0E family protein [Heyndrickxia sp. FSL K6-6286]|nr:aspartyl-phosphate phosphatase Spo0E family protein [Heyndrickxia oleronia]NYV67208.1 aspartyl-phosphate phosphatase Spo0E family protein [Bacillus sp. Gen3]GIN37413.1 hypothetical protein J19TS1_03620 [Heyndrickxia oleronia]
MSSLLHEIEKLRSKLIEYAIQYGLNDSYSIKLSQELDQLLNLELKQR